MVWRGRLAAGFDTGVEDLEAEDGEAVDNQAWALGVERSCRVLGGEVAEEPFVQLLDEVVAALVVAVDGVLDANDLGVGGVGVARFVLFVPEVEVLAVVGGNERRECV